MQRQTYTLYSIHTISSFISLVPFLFSLTLFLPFLFPLSIPSSHLFYPLLSPSLFLLLLPSLPPSLHLSDEDQVYSDLWLLTWTKEDGEVRSCPDDYFSFVHLHGILMYIAWGLLLPLGALLGRYYRQYWPFWFILHIICHVSSTACTQHCIICQGV